MPIPTSSTLALGATNIDQNSVPEHTNVSYDFKQTRINGVAFTNALVMSTYSGNGVVQIDAGRSHSRFLGDLGVPDDQKSETAYQVAISIDNSAPLYTTQIHFGETKPISIDVTNALRVKITISSLTTTSGSIAIGSPRFG